MSQSASTDLGTRMFAVEKAVYVATWVVWLSRHGGTLPAVWDRDPLTATFYAIYGAGDFAFGVFFAWSAWRAAHTGGPS